MSEPFKFETLNTSYVNLAALIRYLRGKSFTGRLHVVLEQYECDVFLYGADSPSIWENDRQSGRESRGEEALQRLLVRAREPGGVITVYEGTTTASTVMVAEPSINVKTEEQNETPGSGHAPSDLVHLAEISNEVISAVERAVESVGGSFVDEFYSARVEVGDDYPFLDPTVGGFEYNNSVVDLQTNPGTTVYVQGLGEALRRVVNRVAGARDGPGIRERVAVELAVAARRFPNGLGLFASQVDRIAGTTVL